MLRCIAILLCLALPANMALAGDPIFKFETNDSEMNKAIKTARSTLDRFFQALRTGESDTWDHAGLKVALPNAQGGNEHIWVGQFRPTSDGYVGVLENEPNDLPKLHKGDSVTFQKNQITDWSFVKDARGYGYFTVHVIVKQMSKEESVNLVAFLNPTPLPKGW